VPASAASPSSERGAAASTTVVHTRDASGSAHVSDPRVSDGRAGLSRNAPRALRLAAALPCPSAEDSVVIKISHTDKNNPPGKLADAELHFTEGILEGLKLIGFGVWERRTGGGRNVTFPARQYVVNGERRSFTLLRPIGDATAQDRIREAILEAYAEYEEKAAVAT
jgi:hypothetical protein